MARTLSKWVPGYAGEIARRDLDTAIVLKSVYRIEIAKHQREWKDDDGRPMKLWRYELELNPPSLDTDNDCSEEGIESTVARRGTKGRHPDQKWLDMATKINKAGIDPYRYIRAQFLAMNIESLGNPGVAPAPNTLNTPKAMAKYLAMDPMLEAEIEYAWGFHMAEFQKAVACCPLAGPDAWANVLYNDDVQLSALFRYCMAFDVGKKSDDNQLRNRFSRICQTYRYDAAEQYLDHPSAYDRTWGVERIPAKFRRQAKDMYETRHGREVI